MDSNKINNFNIQLDLIQSLAQTSGSSIVTQTKGVIIPQVDCPFIWDYVLQNVAFKVRLSEAGFVLGQEIVTR